MRCLVTGIGGFVGRHLATLLAQRGHDVHGTVRTADPAQLAALQTALPALRERIEVVDVVDAQAVARAVAAVQPAVLFHLAGITFVPDSHADPAAVMRVNVLGAVHVFAAVKRHAPRARVVAVGSGDAYGAVRPDEVPVREHCPFRPLNPYGASKAALDVIADQWSRGEGLDIVRVRAFNHTGPGQRPDFVCPDFARQLVAVAAGEHPPVLSVGDLELVRDFTDVRDVAAAYVALAEHGAAGEAYNVCSGVGRSILSILETLSAIVGVQVRTDVAPHRLRPVSVPVLIGCAEKLHAATGWIPQYDWQRTLTDVVNDYRR